MTALLPTTARKIWTFSQPAIYQGIPDGRSDGSRNIFLLAYLNGVLAGYARLQDNSQPAELGMHPRSR